MNIFLTGDIKVGKTTIIDKILADVEYKVLGFKTFWKLDEDGSSTLYMQDLSIDDELFDYSESSVMARRIIVGENKFDLEVYSENFDTFGAGILNRIKELYNASEDPHFRKKHIVLMDEIGFMEERSEDFKRAVFDALNGDLFVLGVVRDCRSEFLDNIRGHSNVAVIIVTKENRDNIVNDIKRLIAGCI